MNPVSRLITAIVAVLVLTGAFFFGLAVLAILIVVLSVFAIIFYVRIWWLGRRHGNRSVNRSSTVSDDKVIDAEYTGISKHRR